MAVVDTVALWSATGLANGPRPSSTSLASISAISAPLSRRPNSKADYFLGRSAPKNETRPTVAESRNEERIIADI